MSSIIYTEIGSYENVCISSRSVRGLNFIITYPKFKINILIYFNQICWFYKKTIAFQQKKKRKGKEWYYLVIRTGSK
jgi:hypothetical protein